MYDLIIRNGMVVDGTRAPAYQADVCIQNGRIAEITAQCGAEAKEVIDAAGKVVSPGFIDIHTHSDLAPLSTTFVGIFCERSIAAIREA